MFMAGINPNLDWPSGAPGEIPVVQKPLGLLEQPAIKKNQSEQDVSFSHFDCAPANIHLLKPQLTLSFKEQECSNRCVCMCSDGRGL